VDLLNGNGVFFVSSLQAMKAKRDNNKEELLRSGYLKMEKYLEMFLVKCKGYEKLASMTATMDNISKELDKTIKEHLNTVDLSLDDFQKRIKNVNEKMEVAKKKAELFIREFNLELDKYLENIRPIISSMIDEAQIHLEAWQSEYVCSVTTEIIHIKKTAKAISDEYSSYLRNRFDTYALQWSKDVLIPELNNIIKTVAEKMKDRAIDLSNIIKDIKVDLSFEKNGNDVELSTDTTKIVSVVYAFLTGDILTAIIGGVLGKEAMIRTMSLQFAVGIALGIVSLFTPIGIGAVIVGGIIATFTGAAWSLSKIQSNIVKKITKEYRTMLSDQSNIRDINDKIFAQINIKISDIRKNIESCAFADINQIEMDIKNILEEKKKGEEDIAKRKESLINAKYDIEVINNNLKEILTEAKHK